MPVKIERVRFHATPPSRAFRLHPTERISVRRNSRSICKSWTRTAVCCVEVQGFTVRPTGHGAQRSRSTLYEYQWKLDTSVRRAGAAANSRHLPSPDALAPFLQQDRRGPAAAVQSAPVSERIPILVAGDRRRLHRARACVNWAGRHVVRGVADRAARRSIGYGAAIPAVAPVHAEGP